MAAQWLDNAAEPQDAGFEQGAHLAWLRQHWALLAALSWLCAGALYLTLPPGPDQFSHSYMGWRLMEGDTLYRDFIDMNWPGTICLHALATGLFGVHLWSWRALDFLLFGMSALFLSDLVRLAAGKEAGKLSLVLCPLIYAGVDNWIAGQHDMSAAQFLLGALWFHVRAYERKRWQWQLGAGIFLGAAMLNKPTVGVMAVLLPMQALWVGVPSRTVLAQTLAAALASLATLLSVMGAVLTLGTPLADLLDAIYRYNIATQYLPSGVADAPTAGGGSSRAAGAVTALLYGKLHWWFAMSLLNLPFLFWLLRRSHRTVATTALLVLGLTGVLSFVIQARGFGYHLSPLGLAMVGGVAASIVLVAEGRIVLGSNAWRQPLRQAFIAVAVGWIMVRLAAAYYPLPAAVLTGDYRAYLSRFNAGGDLVIQDVVAFTQRLDALPPGDCVLELGTVTSINYLSKRRQPTRFYYFSVLSNARPPLPMAERWVDLWEKDLQAADCPFAVIAEGIQKNWLPGPGPAPAALRKFLSGYNQTGSLGATGGMVIYERK